jgi:hypothetical protein
MSLNSRLDACAARVDALSSRFDKFTRRRADAVEQMPQRKANLFAVGVTVNTSLGKGRISRVWRHEDDPNKVEYEVSFPDGDKAKFRPDEVHLALQSSEPRRRR